MSFYINIDWSEAYSPDRIENNIWKKGQSQWELFRKNFYGCKILLPVRREN